jgi:hypothetical protein
MNTRRHWLNCARGIIVSRRLASRIELTEQREIWTEQENVVRERVYDVLKPTFNSYQRRYYEGQPTGKEGSLKLPIAEASLVVIYGWVEWPEDLPDPIDRHLKFSEDRLEKMRLLGPRGVAEFIDALRLGSFGEPDSANVEN